MIVTLAFAYNAASPASSNVNAVAWSTEFPYIVTPVTGFSCIAALLVKLILPGAVRLPSVPKVQLYADPALFDCIRTLAAAIKSVLVSVTAILSEPACLT